jgi:predicted Zn-dependent peptidase
MRDRQKFKKRIFKNGISLYTYKDKFPVANIQVILPFGSSQANQKNGLYPGTFHFLEHLLFKSSQNFPEPHSLELALGLRGGYSNGSTGLNHITFSVEIPSSEIEFASQAIIDRVFRANIRAEFLEAERGIIINERDKNKFYPGSNPSSQFLCTSFINDTIITKENIFGRDEDLAQMDEFYLQKVYQQIIHSPEIQVIAVGNSDFSYMIDFLSSLQTIPQEFQIDLLDPEWVNFSYSKYYFEDINQPALFTGWLYNKLTHQEIVSLEFIKELLCNYVHGPLFQEFREEKGWLYNISSSLTYRQNKSFLIFQFQVNEYSQTEFIRKALNDRIQRSLTNQSLIESEIERQNRQFVYLYQTSADIAYGASNDLKRYRRIYSEKEILKINQKMIDPKWRQALYQKFFDPTKMGSMVFLPERRRKVLAREKIIDR